MTARLADTPVLATARLRLRAPGPQDWPAWSVFARSDRAKYIGGPYDEGHAWRSFGHAIGHWVLRGYGSFVFTAPGSDDAIGMAGPWFPANWPEPEIGWTLWSADAEGQGLACEAATAARAHAYDSLGWTGAVSYIAPGNARSIALAERMGAVRDDACARPGPDDLVYRHPAPGSC